MAVLQRGAIVADDAPHLVLTPALLEQVFAVRANYRERPGQRHAALPALCAV
jgi:ABC-type cobalamin/Fe3+-siderophores transport system ATPase subunit